MARRSILDNENVKKSDWFFKKNFKNNEEHLKLLDSTKPSLYIISKFDDDMFRMVKPGYCEGASKSNNKRCVADRISENIGTSESLETFKYVIEAVIPLPDDFIELCKLKGIMPDVYIHNIMRDIYDYKPQKSNGNKKLEFHYCTDDKGNLKKEFDVIELYHRIVYIVNHQGNVFQLNENENVTKFHPRELQKEETDKCLKAFFNGATEYLENAACRFGKTFMGFFVADGLFNHWVSKKSLDENSNFNEKIFAVLVYSIKREVLDEWKKKCASFGYAFICTDKSYGPLEEQFKRIIEEARKKGITNIKILCFASVMDLYGRDSEGNVKEKNIFIHNPPFKWNLAIGDEFHFGLHNKNASKTFSISDYNEEEIEAYKKFKREEHPIKADYFLFMTATGYASISSGRFPNNFSIVTYADMKRCIDYYAIPNIKLLTINHSEEALKEYIIKNKRNQFSLSKLFKAVRKEDGSYRFVHPNQVYRFLCYLFDINRKNGGCLFGNSSDEEISKAMLNSIIVLDEIASCYALANMLKERFPFIGKYYYIHTVAGSETNAISEKEKIIKEMIAISDGTDSHNNIGTITITCGKLLTGVSVEQWSAMILLTGKTKAEFLHQSIGRLFTPYVDDCGIVRKPYVVIVDPDPNRALYFRNTFDNMERIKKSTSTRREVYCDLENIIEFISVNEKGEFNEMTYEKVLEQRVTNGKHVDYLRNNSFVIGTRDDIKNAVEKYGLDVIFTGRKIKTPVQSVQITSNPLIVPISSQVVNNDSNEQLERDKDYAEILKKIVDTLGLFCFVYDKPIESFNDLKNVPNNIIKQYFKVDINVLEDLFENCNVVSMNVFEDMLDIYNTGNKMLDDSVKEYIAI